MLPSRGYFKKNDCPYFEKGLCVRPHCHFRHKKKVLNDNSSSADSQKNLLLSEDLVNVPVKSINSEDSLVASNCASSNKIHHLTNETSLQSDQSSQNSLFAKLVNQANPYENINRHIPCAYTPTPRIKGVYPKNKSSNLSSIDDSKGVTNKQTVFEGYKSVSNTQNEDRFVTNIVQDNFCSTTSRANNKDLVYSVKSQNSTFLPKKSDCEIALFNESNSECYEPLPNITSINSNLDENINHGFSSDYVPSKVIAPESQYEPNSSALSSPFSYVPSKNKPKQNEYVPESTGSIKSKVMYKPSDKTTSRETQYQPESKICIVDYVPTEKSTTETRDRHWLDDENINELTKISSEIEIMKKLLQNEEKEKKTETEESNLKTESTESKTKVEKSHFEKHKTSRSHHKSISSISSESSSRGHSSSKSKSSSSSSRLHSRKSSRSDHHRNSSDKYKKKSSHSDRNSKHHSSKKFYKSSSDKRRKYDSDEKKNSEKKKSEEKSSSDNEMVDNACSDTGDSSGKEENSETESKSGSKKRKSLFENEDREFKFLKKGEELFEDLEEDPEIVEKQCLEIFNSYSLTPEASASKKINEVSLPPEEYENSIKAKKRMAHSTTVTSDHSVLRHKTAKTVRNSIKSAHEVMLERYKAVEKAKESQALQPPSLPPCSPILGLSRPSVKIAAVSNIQQMLQAKKAIQEKINQGLKVNERTTVSQMVPHGTTRVAHTPTTKEIRERPIVKGGSKQVPAVKRQIYLDKLLLETNQIYPTKNESAEEALKLEEEVFRANSGSLPAYNAAFASMLLRTRRRVTALKGGTSKTNLSGPKMSHYDVLSGGKKNFSVIKSKKVDISMLTDRHIYEELLRCKLTPEELKENGFPMESDRPGYATCSLNFDLKYNDKYLYIKKMTGNRRYCIRCSKQYEVDPISLKQYKEGPETCCFHPGKKKSGGRNSDRIYNCCNSASSEGCTTHLRHVTDCNNYEKLPNCVKTLSKENESNPGVFALDCEMVYTRLGYELARVTVVNLKKEIVYDTLVKPKYPIECCNTFFSGIEEKMMEGVETTLKDVQAVLLNMFSDKTILIGHSLDSDLRALHLIHDTVVDTAIIYKNEKYHPYKYSLKDLCAKKISKIIQDNVNGHDSAEDAVAALEIMLNYVKEEVSKYESLEAYEADRAR